jgi:hypothetical protein
MPAIACGTGFWIGNSWLPLVPALKTEFCFFSHSNHRVFCSCMPRNIYFIYFVIAGLFFEILRKTMNADFHPMGIFVSKLIWNINITFCAIHQITWICFNSEREAYSQYPQNLHFKNHVSPSHTGSRSSLVPGHNGSCLVIRSPGNCGGPGPGADCRWNTPWLNHVVGLSSASPTCTIIIIHTFPGGIIIRKTKMILPFLLCSLFCLFINAIRFWTAMQAHMMIQIRVPEIRAVTFGHRSRSRSSVINQKSWLFPSVALIQFYNGSGSDGETFQIYMPLKFLDRLLLSCLEDVRLLPS